MGSIIPCGNIDITFDQVHAFFNIASAQWTRSAYDLLHLNCIDFVTSVLSMLRLRSLPTFVTRAPWIAQAATAVANLVLNRHGEESVQSLSGGSSSSRVIASECCTAQCDGITKQECRNTQVMAQIPRRPLQRHMTLPVATLASREPTDFRSAKNWPPPTTIPRKITPLNNYCGTESKMPETRCILPLAHQNQLTLAPSVSFGAPETLNAPPRRARSLEVVSPFQRTRSSSFVLVHRNAPLQPPIRSPCRRRVQAMRFNHIPPPVPVK